MLTEGSKVSRTDEIQIELSPLFLEDPSDSNGVDQEEHNPSDLQQHHCPHGLLVDRINSVIVNVDLAN